MCSQWHDGCYGDRRSSPTKEDLFLSPDPDTPFCVSGLSASSWITFSPDHLNSTLKSGCGPRGVAAVGVHVRVLVWKSCRQWCVREGVKRCYVNIFIQCVKKIFEYRGLHDNLWSGILCVDCFCAYECDGYRVNLFNLFFFLTLFALKLQLHHPPLTWLLQTCPAQTV